VIVPLVKYPTTIAPLSGIPLTFVAAIPVTSRVPFALFSLAGKFHAFGPVRTPLDVFNVTPLGSEPETRANSFDPPSPLVIVGVLVCRDDPILKAVFEYEKLRSFLIEENIPLFILIIYDHLLLTLM